MRFDLNKAKSSPELIARLKEVPWQEVRPGVLVREVTLRVTFGDETPQDAVLVDHRWVCQLCRDPLKLSNEAPVLLDDLWRATFPDNGVVCTACLENRLGRPITRADLKPNVLLNAVWRTSRGVPG